VFCLNLAFLVTFGVLTFRWFWLDFRVFLVLLVVAVFRKLWVFGVGIIRIFGVFVFEVLCFVVFPGTWVVFGVF